MRIEVPPLNCMIMQTTIITPTNKQTNPPKQPGELTKHPIQSSNQANILSTWRTAHCHFRLGAHAHAHLIPPNNATIPSDSRKTNNPYMQTCMYF